MISNQGKACWLSLVLFLLSRRAGVDGQFNLAEREEQWHLPFCGFPWGTPKIKNQKFTRLRISPYRLLKTEKTLPKESPCKIPSSWQKFTKYAHDVHTKRYENSGGPPPHDMKLWEAGRHLAAPPPPSDIKYATSWVWTKNLIGSTPPPSFGDDAPSTNLFHQQQKRVANNILHRVCCC